MKRLIPIAVLALAACGGTSHSDETDKTYSTIPDTPLFDQAWCDSIDEFYGGIDKAMEAMGENFSRRVEQHARASYAACN
jgi:hypothetical protein